MHAHQAELQYLSFLQGATVNAINYQPAFVYTYEVPLKCWEEVLSRVPNLLWLWTEARLVSKSFAYGVEQAFIKNWIPNKFSLRYDIGTRIQGRDSFLIAGQFNFHHFSPDFQTVFLADPKALSAIQQFLSPSLSVPRSAFEEKERYFNCWLATLEQHFRVNTIKLPPCVAVLKHTANDTHLPHLKFSPATTFVEFEWRGMLSNLFREQIQLKKKSRESADAMSEFRDKHINLPPMTLIPMAMMLFSQSELINLRMVRRQRITRAIFKATGYMCRDEDFQGADVNASQVFNVGKPQTPEQARLTWIRKLGMEVQEEFETEEDDYNANLIEERTGDLLAEKGRGRKNVEERGTKNYKKLKVAELQDELEKRGLKKNGNKAELITRLQEDDQGMGDRKRIRVH